MKTIEQSAPIVAQWSAAQQSGGKQNVKMIHAQNILRPQLKFEDKVDNSNRSFVPQLKVKLHAKQPYDPSEFCSFFLLLSFAYFGSIFLLILKANSSPTSRRRTKT